MPTISTHPHGDHRAGELAGDHLDTPVGDFMTPGVVSIAEDASLIQVFRAMRAHNVHAVLVVGTRHLLVTRGRDVLPEGRDLAREPDHARARLVVMTAA